MGTLSPIHWILVLVVVLLLFGPSRLAGFGRVFGDAARALKRAAAGNPRDKANEKRST